MQAPRFVSVRLAASEAPACCEKLFFGGIGGILRCQFSVQSLLLPSEAP